MKENDSRRCSKCGIIKTLDNFYIDRTKNCYQRYCKACAYEYLSLYIIKKKEVQH